MIVGIVGHEGKKFTLETKAKAMDVIESIIVRPEVTGVTSGHCHLGGIDIWAEEIAKKHGKYDPSLVFPPASRSWEHGFKPRNIKIAETSDECHCIVVKEYPDTYTGMRFKMCYHCKSDEHLKSGGCWTVHYAMKLGKKGIWHVI